MVNYEDDIRQPYRKLDERQKHLEDLQRDKFGRQMPSTPGFQEKNKTPTMGYLPGGSVQFLPMDNEKLSDYIKRIGSAVDEIMDISYHQHIDTPRGGWYTHKNNPPMCWICIQGNGLLILYHSLLDMSENINPKNYIYKHDANIGRKKLVKL